MKHSDIALLMKGMAPVIGDLISKTVQPLVERIGELEQQVAEMPVPKDGRDGVDGKDGTAGRDGADGRDGIDGKDADPITPEQIAGAVAEYLAANPPAAGKDGRDGIDGKDGEPGAAGNDGAPGEKGADGKDGIDGAPGLDGKDGVGLAGAFQNKDGHLILTLTNGATADVGLIAGKDGRDGAPGKDGADALGFDDLAVEHDGERGFAFKMQRGEQVKEFAFTVPMVIDRGVWNEGREGGYAKGDGVTWAGSFWISQKDENGDKPDGGNGWRLAVKRGRDGRNGEAKTSAPKTPIKVG